MLSSICSDCFAHEVFMKTNSLRRWSRPKVILIISMLTENPAHTLRVVSGLRTTAARLFLVQLPTTPYNIVPPRRDAPFLVTAPPTRSEQQPGNGAAAIPMLHYLADCVVKVICVRPASRAASITRITAW